MGSSRLHMESPAQGWRDALPCGNGVLGALVYGRVAGERILFNHESLWSRGNTPPVPETAGRLDELRAMLIDGRFAEAEQFFPSLWKESGFKAETAHYLPGPDLCITSVPTHPFEEYRSTLDMQTGEVLTRWRENGFDYERRTLVSKVCGLAVIQLNTGNPDGLNVCLELQAHDPRDSLEYSGFGGVHAPQFQTETEGALIRLTAQFEDGTSYLAEVKVCGASVEEENSGLRVQGEQSVTLLFRMIPLNDSLQAVLPDWPSDTCFDVLRAAHVARHAVLMNRIEFSLGAVDSTSNERMLLDANKSGFSSELVEKLFHYGRYLLISSSTGAAVYPAHLQGLWNGDYKPAWTCGIFNNENVQMNYWSSLAGNLPEALLPLFNAVESLMDDFRENARRMYGCRGILMPLFMSPRSGRKHNPQSHVVYWSAGAGWIAQHFFDYWLYTGDREFLLTRAIPFMKETALFYEDFFTEGADGYWVSAPSQSPENNPLGDFPEAGNLSICTNATMDFSVAKELFTRLIEISEQFGLNAGQLPRWKEFLQKIPPYRINEDGALAEWMDARLKDNYHHRHLAHLYPLFPGRETCLYRSPELFVACREAVEKRLVIGIRDQTGWSLAHMASIYARLRGGAKALECLRLLTRSCLGKNLFTYHNSDLDMGLTQPLIHGMPSPFQIDANFGLTAAVLEMLLFCRPAEIHLLPALPDVWPKGSIRGIRAMGGISADIYWDEKTVTALLTADQDQKCAVYYADNRQPIELSGGIPIELQFERNWI